MKVIILDLNGVLVDRQFTKKLDDNADMHVINGYGSRWNVFFKSRLVQFMELALESDNVVGVWTSARKENAKPIVDRIFKDREPDFFLSQEDCLIYGEYKDSKKPPFLKFYNKLTDMGYDPSDMVFVDDDFYKLRFNAGARYIDPSHHTLTEIWMLINSTHGTTIEHVPLKSFLHMRIETKYGMANFVSRILLLLFLLCAPFVIKQFPNYNA